MDQVVERWETLQQTIIAVFTWFTDRFAGVNPSWSMVLVALLIASAIIAIMPIWALTRNVVTIVHEMGHVIVARLCGRTIQGIRLKPDTSGLTVSRGKEHGFGMLLTALAGYPAPGVVGLGLVWAVFLGYAGIALMLLVVLLVLAVLLVRNLWGAMVMALSLIGSGLVLWQGDPTWMSAVVLTLGLFLSFGGLRATWGLSVQLWRGDLNNSDAQTAGENSLVPAVMWLGYFFVLTILSAVLSLLMAVLMAYDSMTG